MHPLGDWLENTVTCVCQTYESAALAQANSLVYKPPGESQAQPSLWPTTAERSVDSLWRQGVRASGALTSRNCKMKSEWGLGNRKRMGPP